MTKPLRIAQRPRDIAHCVSAFLEEGNLDGIASMFHPTCKIFFPPDQPPAIGKQGAKEVFTPFLEIKPKIESQVISEVIVGDTALVRAKWKVITPNGHVISEGESTEVAKKMDDHGWVYLIDCPVGPPIV